MVVNTNLQIKTFMKYPVDFDDYAIGLEYNDKEGILEYFDLYGFVVIRDVIDNELIQYCEARINFWLHKIGAFSDQNGLRGLSRGFLEVYHDDFLAQVRQSPKLYQAHTYIWNREDLWCTYDRIAYKPNDGESSIRLPLHVDQNPLINPDFACTQGLVAINNCTSNSGTTILVPGSHKLFMEWAKAKNNNPNSLYIDIENSKHKLVSKLKENAQSLPIRNGHALIWDSRTIHANTNNTSDDSRSAILVSYQPADYRDEVVRKRHNFMLNCLAGNDRDARMHASTSPRFYNPSYMQAKRIREKLTPLGQLVYGFTPYS